MKRLVFKVEPKSPLAKKITEFWDYYIRRGYKGDAPYYIIEYDDNYKIVDYLAYDDYAPKYDDILFDSTSMLSFIHFPKVIREEMIKRSVSKSPVPFVINLTCSTSDGGFRWSDQPEDHDFWFKVIDCRNFDLFYKQFKIKEHESRLSKQESPLRGGSSNITSGICCRKHKARVTVVSLGYQKVTGRG